MPRAQAAASAAGAQRAARGEAESTYAWMRLLASLALSSIGGVGMWSVAVVLPAVQAEFGVARSAASLPYTLTMLGFGFGGILMGRLSDRFGIVVPVVVGAFALALGFGAASAATSLWQFAAVQGLLIGLLGSSSSFAPLVADTSLWFTRRRGIAVAICASGNYVAGAIWPPVIQHFVETAGWRTAYLGVGLFCLVDDAAARARAAPPAAGARSWRSAGRAGRHGSDRPLGFSPATLQWHPLRRRHRLLRGDVDAAGPHRRVLRRPRLRRRARRGDALPHARRRRDQPPRFGLDLRPHRRLAHAAARVGAAGPRAAAVPAVRRARLALRDLGALRARSRAASCPPTR